MRSKNISSLLGKIIIGFIYLYRIGLSPLLAPCCRFHPSCSTYMTDAIRLYGPIRGSYLGLRRLLRCHPFHPGGYDPVR